MKHSEQADGDMTNDSESDLENDQLSNNDKIAIWQHSAASRGKGFLDSEKEFIVKEFRKLQGPGKPAVTKPVLESIIENGRGLGILLACLECNEIQYLEKVRHFIRKFLEVLDSDSD